MRKSGFLMLKALKSAPHPNDKVFEHLKQLWMATDVSPDLGKFSEIIVLSTW
jgi:hypothetical protein